MKELENAVKRLLILLPLLLGLVGCAELNDLRERNQTQDRTIKRLTEENAKFQDAYYKIKDTLDNEHAQAEKKGDQLSRELEQARTLKSKQEKELSDQLHTRQLEYEALKTESAEQKKQAEAKIAQQQRDQQALQAEKDAALARIKDLDDKLRAELGRTTDLTKQVASFKVDVQSLNDRVGGLQKDVASRDQALQAAEKKATELGQKLTAQQQSLQQSQDQAAQLKKQLDESSALKTKFEQAQTESKALSGQIESLKTKHAREIEASKADAAKAKAVSPADDPELKSAVEQVRANLKGVANVKGIRVRLETQGLRIIIPDHLLFDENSSLLADRASAALGPIVESLRQLPGHPVRIVGHTDNQPVKDLPYADNWGLGFARADRVRDFLTQTHDGLSGERLTASSRAQYDPLASNSTPEGRKENRRVEIIVGAKAK